MQKLLRTAIMILLVVIVFAVVYTQAQIYTQPHAAAVSGKSVIASHPVEPVETPAAETPTSSPAAAATPAAPASAPVPASTLGTESSPVIVKLAEAPESDYVAAEQEKNRDILRGIEHAIIRVAKTSLAQNFLLLFIGILYFLSLIIIYLLFENVRKLTEAAVLSAEAAKKSAEMAEAAVARRQEHQQNNKRFGQRKFPPHYYRKR